MHWSRFNSLFRANGDRFFVYNSLSNALLQVNEHYYSVLERFALADSTVLKVVSESFSRLLHEKGFLVNEMEEYSRLMELKYKRDSLCFDNSHLDLSICPTLGCNFRCSYCFESRQNDFNFMRADTVDKLTSFINSFVNIKSLSLTWYGGEPTINRAFNIIKDITRRIKDLGVSVKEIGLVTNAYLLGKDKIEELNNLGISSVQITLDGPQEVHDKRRVLAGGHPTFHRIMENIDTLLCSSYKGSCNIRVNIDQTNVSSFFDIRKHLLSKYKGKNLTIYAGRIDTATTTNNKRNCDLCSSAWTDFALKQYTNWDLQPSESIYPVGSVFNICSANTKNSFVIGPEGELYKCWEDVGRSNMVIGSIHEPPFIFNTKLVALYSVGTDPFLDKDCTECTVFPICSGGCANRRLRDKHFNEHGLEYCSLYKKHLHEFLLSYFDAFETRELCGLVLGVERINWNEIGYREIHP